MSKDFRDLKEIAIYLGFTIDALNKSLGFTIPFRDREAIHEANIRYLKTIIFLDNDSLQFNSRKTAKLINDKYEAKNNLIQLCEKMAEKAITVFDVEEIYENLPGDCDTKAELLSRLNNIKYESQHLRKIIELTYLESGDDLNEAEIDKYQTQLDKICPKFMYIIVTKKDCDGKEIRWALSNGPTLS